MAEDQSAAIKVLNDLSGIVSELGGTPSRDAHFGGILHRGWVDLETRIRPKDNHDILEDCHRGDEETLKHYQHALDQRLPEQARITVERQADAIRRELAELQSMTKRQNAQHA